MPTQLRLILLFLAFTAAGTSCKKTSEVPGPEQTQTNSSSTTIDSTLTQRYTHKMEGNRNWKKYLVDQGNEVFLGDTSFAVSVVNDTTITVWGVSMPYTTSYVFGTINHMGIISYADTTRYLLFGKSYTQGLFAMEYYYAGDSMALYSVGVNGIHYHSVQ